MVTFLEIDPGLKFIVAFQAFLVRDLLPQDMAFRAVGHAFEVGMHFGEFAGGDLGADRETEDEEA